MKFLATKKLLIKKTAALAIIASFLLTNAFVITAFAGDTKQIAASDTAITKFTTDLTLLGHSGRLREIPSFENETRKLVEVLENGGLRQPVILDEKGENQDQIVEQLALRIARGQVSARLAGMKVLKLEAAALFSNSKSETEASANIESIIDTITSSKDQIILFVPELTNFVGIGGFERQVGGSCSPRPAEINWRHVARQL